MNPDIQRAVTLLQAGELVALPTETVYGLGADAANPQAVARIFAAKGRPADHPLIVHVPGAAHLERWACDIPDLAWELAEDFWPGPLTLILKRQPWVPAAVTGGQDTVGLRVPGHPLALDLLRAFAAAGGGQDGHAGIAAPSANRFGRISPTTAAHVREELGAQVAMILDGGPCAVGIESTIIDLSHGAPRLLRPGRITPAQIEAACGICPLPPGGTAPRASGTLEAHYAPRTPMRMLATSQLAACISAETKAGHRCALLAHTLNGPDALLATRYLPSEPTGYAHDLYAALRELDHSGADLILVEEIPGDPNWAAVADRLRRAVCGAGADAAS